MRSIQSSLLYQWFNEVWNRGDETAVDRLMTTDSTAHGILNENQPKGVEGFKAFLHDFKTNFHDIHISVDDVIRQDDVESARTTVAAIHTATGKPVTFSGMCMVRIADGKIAEAWNNYDFLHLYEQLGQKLAPAQ